MPKKDYNGSSKSAFPPGVKDLLGPDIAKAFSNAMRNMPYREKWTKGNGKWQKGGLIKGKPKLTKRGC